MNFAQHLTLRGLDESTGHRFVNHESELVYFYLYSTHGSLIGYQRYGWQHEKIRGNKGRYFTWLTDEYRLMGIWGWHSVVESSGPIYIVEGIWDAIRIHNTGRPAIAMLTATPHKQTVQYLRWNTLGRKKVGLLDNDENKAGLALAKTCDLCYTVPVGKDMGDMTPEQAQQFLGGLE